MKLKENPVLSWTQKVKVKLLLTQFFDVTIGGMQLHCQKVIKANPSEQQQRMVTAFELLIAELGLIHGSELSDFEVLKKTLSFLEGARADFNKGIEYTIAADELYNQLMSNATKKGLVG